MMNKLRLITLKNIFTLILYLNTRRIRINYCLIGPDDNWCNWLKLIASYHLLCIFTVLYKSTSKQVKDGNSNPSESFIHEKKHFLTFKGKVRYSNKIGDCGYVCEAILDKLESLEELVVGFDLEWPVQWTKGAGQHKTALIQFCPSVRVCYLFHVTEWKSLPKVFVDFISHPKVRLVGVNIKADIWKLGRDFDISVVQIVGFNAIELRSLANQVFSTQEIWSLDRLVLYVLKKKLDKSDVRTSNWAQETLTAHQLGYAATDAYALIIQKKVANHIKTLMTEGEVSPSGAVLLVEHNPVYTIGLRTKQYSVKDEDKLKQLGAEFYKTDRGGLITFHGPGQLVVYPILNLKRFKPSVKWYVCMIEKVVIDLCREYGLKAETSPDTGVWVDDKKICAIGIHGSRFVTTHGFALNCSTDLEWFSHIVPCGIEGKGVTSVSNELGKTITPNDVLPRLIECFNRGFSCKLDSVRDYTDIDVLLRSIH